MIRNQMNGNATSVAAEIDPIGERPVNNPPKGLIFMLLRSDTSKYPGGVMRLL
jgi:hypothetical protein